MQNDVRERSDGGRINGIELVSITEVSLDINLLRQRHKEGPPMMHVIENEGVKARPVRLIRFFKTLIASVENVPERIDGFRQQAPDKRPFVA